MLRNKTLFVLGAGSSAEVNMPVGSALAVAINKAADLVPDHSRGVIGTGDRDLFDSIQKYYLRTIDTSKVNEQMNAIVAACRVIRAGSILAASIDDFLSVHSHNKHVQLFGKAPIVKSILHAEAKSKLFFNEMTDQPNWLNIKDTWYARLFSMMSRGLSKDMAPQLFDRAYFINFNYDRTLEQFLTYATKDFFNIQLEEAAEIVDSARIVHPYGTAGTFDRGRSANSRTRFGNVDEQSLVDRASNIRTYTEEMQNGDDKHLIAQFVYECPVIVFLGFAFHEQNIKLLLPTDAQGPRSIYATALGISPPNCAEISVSLANFCAGPSRSLFVPAIQERMHRDLKCVHLLDYYSKVFAD